MKEEEEELVEVRPTRRRLNALQSQQQGESSADTSDCTHSYRWRQEGRRRGSEDRSRGDDEESEEKSTAARMLWLTHTQTTHTHVRKFSSLMLTHKLANRHWHKSRIRWRMDSGEETKGCRVAHRSGGTSWQEPEEEPGGHTEEPRANLSSDLIVWFNNNIQILRAAKTEFKEKEVWI